MFAVGQFGGVPLELPVARIALAGALGLFLGLEREWSHKSAGIRTYSLISLLGAVFTILGGPWLLLVGGLLVIVQGVVLAVEGLREEDTGLSLTTSVSMMVTYGVGALVADGFIIEGVTVAVISSLLLVLKRELHSFAWGLSREELRSATEFAILAFVVYPLLPGDPTTFTVAETAVEVEFRVVWLLVVTVAGIGIVNYAVVRAYGGRGVAITGFFGGLASSTAVVGTMIDHVEQRPATAGYALAAIMLADAAMALRNLVIALAFTLEAGLLVQVIAPLAAVVVASAIVALVQTDWSDGAAVDLESPFSLRNALVFGAVFLVLLVAGTVALALFGNAGLYVTSGLTGLVSSAGATTTAVVLYRGGAIGAGPATVAILVATGGSIIVKAGLTLLGPDRGFARSVTRWSLAVLAVAAVATAAVVVV